MPMGTIAKNLILLVDFVIKYAITAANAYLLSYSWEQGAPVRLS